MAAGQYLAPLEEANLSKYQNNSVYEVLSYEFLNCAEKQKKKLKSVINIKEVLGNYCQPHLPPPRNASSKDQFMKGADLYSWREQSGYVWYAILPETNRSKNEKELTENKISPGFLKQELQNIPARTEIAWNNLAGLEKVSNLELMLPDGTTLQEILKSAEMANLNVTVIK